MPRPDNDQSSLDRHADASTGSVRGRGCLLCNTAVELDSVTTGIERRVSADAASIRAEASPAPIRAAGDVVVRTLDQHRP